MNKNMLITGFETWISGVGSDSFTHWATTTAHYDDFFAYTPDKNL